ncbi:MAG: ABC transporter permease [Gammaproteobacteria bacterium]|nr:ABC transporter permease [Gammaproteobacteria bacterium]MDH3858154.1 ABC transporter permease [Gammaproteobacteria bacterium]
MIQFLLRRVLQAAIVMLIISLFCFSIQDTLGDPTRELAAMSMSEVERANLRESLGLNDPLLVQYGRFITRALQGDLGTSYFFKEPTLDVILKKLPATLELSFAASLIIIFVSIPMGVFCAIKPRHWFSRFTMAVSVVGISIPVFLTALAMIFIFSITLGWMPSFGRGEVVQVWAYWSTNFASWDGIVHIIMPAIALSSIMLPLFIRLVRAEMLEVLSSEYVKFARAKGLSAMPVYLKHALKNTMLPVITVGGVQIGIMVAYTILTESVFQWPGMGFMFLEAVNRSDIPLITAYIMFVGFLFVVVNTLVDLLYGVINPMVDLVGRRQ